MRLNSKILGCSALLVFSAGPVPCRAQELSVSVKVSVTRAAAPNTKSPANKDEAQSTIAVWLTPLEQKDANSVHPDALEKPPRLVQRHKTFEPHVLIVPVGTKVEFPNKDPFFHNIFSLYDGRRFDLGLYEAGTTRTVLFDRAGVSFLFCNIHAEMSAVVLSVNTPYFGLSDRSGNVVIRNVPNGRYQLNIWYERATPEYLKGLIRIVTISDAARNLGPIQIEENPNFTPSHKNKYGLDYVPPPNAEYDRP
jgi:plastocyanin